MHDMNRRTRFPTLLRRALICTILLLTGVEAVLSDDILVLDDFSRADGRPLIGASWEGFTDRVMGGQSQMESGMEVDGDRQVLRMRGRVSLENNGGFIQMRLALASSGTYDAGRYRGVVAEVRSRAPHADGYFLHLRTRRTRFPWSHYRAPIEPGPEWQRISVPFDRFEPQYMFGNSPPDPNTLRSVAIVAAGDEFSADIEVRMVGFYR